MKLNVAYPATGQQKYFEVDDEKKLRIFYEKRMAQEVEADVLGDEWAPSTGAAARVTDDDYRPAKRIPPPPAISLDERRELVMREMRATIATSDAALEKAFRRIDTGDAEDTFVQYKPVDRFNKDLAPKLSSAEFARFLPHFCTVEAPKPRQPAVTNIRAHLVVNGSAEAVTEASYVNLPVISFTNTDSPLKMVDIAIPCNNKVPYFLARPGRRPVDRTHVVVHSSSAKGSPAAVDSSSRIRRSCPISTSTAIPQAAKKEETVDAAPFHEAQPEYKDHTVVEGAGVADFSAPDIKHWVAATANWQAA